MLIIPPLSLGSAGIMITREKKELVGQTHPYRYYHLNYDLIIQYCKMEHHFNQLGKEENVKYKSYIVPEVYYKHNVLTNALIFTPVLWWLITNEN